VRPRAAQGANACYPFAVVLAAVKNEHSAALKLGTDRVAVMCPSSKSVTGIALGPGTFEDENAFACRVLPATSQQTPDLIIPTSPGQNPDSSKLPGGATVKTRCSDISSVTFSELTSLSHRQLLWSLRTFCYKHRKSSRKPAASAAWSLCAACFSNLLPNGLNKVLFWLVAIPLDASQPLRSACSSTSSTVISLATECTRELAESNHSNILEAAQSRPPLFSASWCQNRPGNHVALAAQPILTLCRMLEHGAPRTSNVLALLQVLK
jgi:hypothetical protein